MSFFRGDRPSLRRSAQNELERCFRIMTFVCVTTSAASQGVRSIVKRGFYGTLVLPPSFNCTPAGLCPIQLIHVRPQDIRSREAASLPSARTNRHARARRRAAGGNQAHRDRFRDAVLHGDLAVFRHRVGRHAGSTQSLPARVHESVATGPAGREQLSDRCPRPVDRRFQFVCRRCL